jgi:hypothetical protein
MKKLTVIMEKVKKITTDHKRESLVALLVFIILTIVTCYGCSLASRSSGKYSGVENNPEILTALKQGTIEVAGIYYEVAPDTGKYKITSSGEPREYIENFKGTFENIKDITFRESKDESVTVFFTADIKNDHYILKESQGIEAFLQKNEDKSYSFQSATIAEKSKPLVLPAYPFDIEYIYQKNQVVSFQIPANTYDEKKYLSPGATAEYSALQGKYTGGIYIITFKISHDTVKNIELLPEKGNIAIQSNPFKYKNPVIQLTLANGLRISTKGDIAYNTKSSNLTPADYWTLNLPNSWGVE